MAWCRSDQRSPLPGLRVQGHREGRQGPQQDDLRAMPGVCEPAGGRWGLFLSQSIHPQCQAMTGTTVRGLLVVPV